MDKIFTARDDAKRKKFPSVTAYVRGLSVMAAQRGAIAFPWDGRTVNGEAVEAFVDHGRWLAQCPICNGAEYVDAETPIFFCCSCGNGDVRSARPVKFPSNREEVEAELLKIEIEPGYGRSEIERMMNGKGKDGRVRSWTPLSHNSGTSPQIADKRRDLGGESEEE
jgi:hypothetical protein